MKKISLFFAFMFLIISYSFLLTGCVDRSKVLKIYNWEDYIDEDVLYGFEDYYQETYGEEIKVEYYTFDTNETMYTKIARSHRDYDLAIPSEYMAQKMINANLAQKIDYSNIPNYYQSFEYSQDGETRLDPTLTEKYSNLSEYFLPYMWGTLGIMYNKDLLKETDITVLEDSEAYDFWYENNEQASGLGEEIQTSTDGLWTLDMQADSVIRNYASLWNEDYENMIYMKDSIRDAYAAASIYASQDVLKEYINGANHGEVVDGIMNDASDASISKIERVLKAQKPFLKGYEVDHGKDEMVLGNVTMLLSWSGDAVWSMWENESLGYYVPDEGSNIWADGFVIPKFARNKLAAERFINYLFMQNIDDPWGEESDYADNGIILMDTIGYTSSLKDVQDRYFEIFIEEYLMNEDEEMLPNALVILDTLFPSQTVKDRCAVMKDFGEQNIDVLKMWARVMAS